VRTAAWFSRLGLPLSTDEASTLRALADGAAGFARAGVECLPDWHAAAVILRATDRDDPWWETEEAERQRLWQCAAERHDESLLLARVAAIATVHGAIVHAAAEASAARDGIVDPAVAGAAASSLLLTLQQSILVELADGDYDHHFVRKRAAFAGGRWPLGYHRGAYFVF
jgi:hypothetical protein